ncbi:pyridoxamine 5'-phosphate oxidase [Winogradskyella sp. A3E31]|uniref:pyridoxamine 5'-phosphate oxidase n=1 Tax=Winogradskyella sp. A3E31 TaxID=3349637 RepID=UPI00398BAAA1
MEKDISHYRKSYEKNELLLNECPDNPLELFKTWFHQVDEHFKDQETNAMTISTIGLDGFPKNRVVLLKKYSDEGFVFYTNYESEKGKSIAVNPSVCLSFFWEFAERQVIIKGKASKVSDLQSDAYFKSRPRGSRLGAIASNQSQVIRDRSVIEDRLLELESQYKDKEISRPKHWGGYIIQPLEIEFWQGRPNRLHDRIRYTKAQNSDWDRERLSP